MAQSWWRQEGAGLQLLVRIQARAGADRVGEVRAGRLQLRIAAAPVDDAANERLCRFMAGLFGLPRASVRLLQGRRSRDKLLAVDGVRQLPASLAGLAETAG
jgi:hypothetical protein